ncbi:MAG: hypothetical protein EOP51_08490 [Sphingobacteriales bacterium]|nr:MAG: hypothetical protein EOP51_08490 [Sphingobacteriales bacterium]
MPKQNYSLLYLFNAVVLIFIVTAFLDRVVQEGMFFDGVTYAAISRNLAIGKGSFWDVYYRGPWRFSEHPTLMFGLQAGFFKILGDSYYTERVYCFVVWLLTIGSMFALWQRTTKNSDARKAFALPLLCWAIMPSVIWSYPNNLLDTNMALFNLWAVYFLYRAMDEQRYTVLNLLAGGICILLATLTKGPIGFFALALPLVYWVVYRNQSLGKTILKSIVPAVVLVVAYWLLFQYEPSKICLSEYLNEQLFKAIAGKRDVVDSPLGRFQLLADICIQALPAGILAIILIGVAKYFELNIAKHSADRRLSVFYLLLTLCGSLPIMISLKQRTFYLTPIFPYLAFALALAILPYFTTIMMRIRIPLQNKTVNATIAIAVLACGIYISGKFGKAGRDEDLLSDIRQLQKCLPKGERIGVCSVMDKDFRFLAYIQRYHQLEVNLQYHKARYVLIDKTICRGSFDVCLPKLGYAVTSIPFRQYSLYKRIIR